MTMYVVKREKLTYDMGMFNGYETLGVFSNKQNCDKFVEEWENKWQENRKNGKTVVGHCWIDSGEKLKVEEIQSDD